LDSNQRNQVKPTHTIRRGNRKKKKKRESTGKGGMEEEGNHL